MANKGLFYSDMCRSIKTLYNFDPPASEKEIYDASLQFVRKISGFRIPSKINEKAFDQATQKIAADARILLHSLKTKGKTRSRI